jgi:hypothetical protein
MACSVTGKDKVGSAKWCFFWVYVCVYVSRREKEAGRSNEYFTPLSNFFTCFHPFSLTRSFTLSHLRVSFFGGLTRGNDISLA